MQHVGSVQTSCSPVQLGLPSHRIVLSPSPLEEPLCSLTVVFVLVLCVVFNPCEGTKGSDSLTFPFHSPLLYGSWLDQQVVSVDKVGALGPERGRGEGLNLQICCG